MSKNIWVLSGGGAKGCFQAGAIEYLSMQLETGSTGKKYKPDVIAGTSVGALNSLLPSQDWTSSIATGAQLADIWLSLEDESDMYDISDGAQNFSNDKFNSTLLAVAGTSIAGISDFLISGRYGPEPAEFEGHQIDFHKVDSNETSTGAKIRAWIKAALRVAGPVFLPGHAIPAIIQGSNAVQVADALNDIGRIKSFYKLTPIADKIREQLDYDLFKANRDCKLYLVSTSINTQTSVAMDRDGVLWQVDSGTRTGLPYAADINKKLIGSKPRDQSGMDRIIDGALASAAIPGAFPPVWLNGHICFDGGVTDPLPISTVLQDIGEYLRASEEVKVISIRCNPPPHIDFPLSSMYTTVAIDPLLGARPSELQASDVTVTKSDSDAASLTNYIPALISSLSSEVSRGDERDLEQYGDQVEHLRIYPSFRINGTAQIDPGLIRIQMCYGWMRADDALRTTDGGAYHLTNQIILARLNAWRLEELSSSLFPAGQIVDRGTFDREYVPGTIEKIRKIKLFIKKHVEKRFREYGLASIPYRNHGDRDPRYTLSTSWFREFERHTWSSNRHPWDTHIEKGGNVVSNLIIEEDYDWSGVIFG